MIRVIIADDHHLIRQGLRQLLEREHDIRVVAEAADGLDVLKTVDQFQTDVVVMDVEMPKINGIEATRRIRDSRPEIQVVMLSIHSDPVLIQEAVDSGARGYVLKSSINVDLVSAIRTVCRGVTYYTKSMRQHEFEQSPHGSEPKLTSREQEVLKLIVAGESNRQIAEILHVSIKTVENHRTNLMAKLNAHSLSTLVRKAIKLGLIELEE